MILFPLLVGEEPATFGERTYECLALVHKEMLSELVLCSKPFGAMLALMRPQSLIMISLVLLQTGCICVIFLTDLTLVVGFANVSPLEMSLHSHGCSVDLATNFTLEVRGFNPSQNVFNFLLLIVSAWIYPQLFQEFW